MKNEHILIVDDDEKLCQILALYLRSKGYEVSACRNGSNALNSFFDSRPDLILLEIMLPGMDGLSVLERLRRISPVPVIMLSSKPDGDDTVSALNSGADDFLVKPFDPKELIARIRAVLRRAANALTEKNDEKTLKTEDLSIDLIAQTATCEGSAAVRLSSKEIELLCCLVENRNKVMTKEQLLAEVWNCGTQSRTVDVHVNRLRVKLPKSDRWRIRTVWRVGYVFETVDDGR